MSDPAEPLSAEERPSKPKVCQRCGKEWPCPTYIERHRAEQGTPFHPRTLLALPA